MLVVLLSALIISAGYISSPFLLDVHEQSTLISTLRVTSLSENSEKSVTGYTVSFALKNGEYNSTNQYHSGDGTEEEIIGFIEASQLASSVYVLHGRGDYPLLAVDLKETFNTLSRNISAEEQEFFLPSFSSYSLSQSIISEPGTAEELTQTADEIDSEIQYSKAFIRMREGVLFITVPEFDLLLTAQEI